jgi:hypothetical protein
VLHQVEGVHDDGLNSALHQVCGIDRTDDPKCGIGHENRELQLMVWQL